MLKILKIKKDVVPLVSQQEGVNEGSEIQQDVHQNETSSFQEGGDTYRAEVKTARDSTFTSVMNDPAQISKFLFRDTFMTQMNWTTAGLTFGAAPNAFIFDVWTQWQSDTRIKDKLRNFTYLTGDLTVSVRVNGSPFQMGRALFAWIPYMENQTSGSWFSVDNRNQVAAMNYGILTATSTPTSHVECAIRHFSTYPHGWIDPSKSNTVEIKIPFVWHNNALSICGIPGTAKESLGRLLAYPVGPLTLVNDNVQDLAVIKIYARMENCKVAIPTEYEPSATEFEQCEKEKPSTVDVVASMVGAPVMKAKTKASEIGAAVSAVGKVFGFSKPATVEEEQPRTLRLGSNFANTAGKDTSEPLSLDPKQEVICSPDAAGLGPEDEMSFESICTREQWLTRADWRGETGQASSQVIYTALVSPNIPTKTYGTPINHNSKDWHVSSDTPGGRVANMFGYWKGSIKFRIEVVCTAMHSGRLLLQFEPASRTAAPVVGDLFVNDVNARYSQILDLREAHTCEFNIEYVSRKPWLETLQETENYQWPSGVNDGSTQLTNLMSRFDPFKHMGIFTIGIMNAAVGPVTVDSANPLRVFVYMSCGDDMEFAMPTEQTGLDSSSFERWGKMVYIPRGCVQSKCTVDADISGNIDDDDFMLDESSEEEPWFGEITPRATEAVLMQSVPGNSAEDEDVFFGESVRSWRTLAKRYSGNAYYDINNVAPTNQVKAIKRNIPFFVPTPHLAKSRYNTFESYMAPSYIARRGSARKRIYPYVQKTGNSGGIYTIENILMLQGVIFAERKISKDTVDMQDNGGNSYAMHNSADLMAVLPHLYNGGTMRNLNYNPMLDVQMPWYSNTRFDLACSPYNVDDTGNEALRLNPTQDFKMFLEVTHFGWNSEAVRFFEFSAVGDDYSASFYVGPPAIWLFEPA
ncbi:TPA_asm: capsid protein precursor [Apostichopus japonicus associated picornavirus 3]|nr:TPA_asm: capsid protein precursor [Apostichopus japonicus associated picornavirus 3]